ncbi:hypothetical protein PINS_up008289 [Pythium insidiosum]|nr:hypothetical protein PINS_up008289 [Pythium insidiosum]
MMIMQDVVIRLLLLVATACSVASAEHWAVIVAGSRGYWNYRHQADACHAYHVVRRHGIPAENVILMMYDDVASAPENPFPGKIFNRPDQGSNGDAVDVYAGCHVDYRGDDVTPDMFLSVLLGDDNATKGRKVLNATAEDRVFINFVDHGADGVLLFPDDGMLRAKQLLKTLQQMHFQKRYKELVFYVEACESGSMFHDDDMRKINVFVTTAASASESSYGTFCPPMDVVNGTALGTCLGDLYSVNWMEDSDLTDLSGETLQQQYRTVKEQTNLSHVLQFGSKQVRREIVGNFQSNYDQAPEDASSSDDEETTMSNSPESPLDSHSIGAISSRDVDLVLTFYRYLRSASGPKRQKLAQELIQVIEQREQSDRIFERIRSTYQKTVGVELIRLPIATTQLPSDCQDRVLRAFEQHCGLKGDANIGSGFSSYSLKYLSILNDLCGALDDDSAIEDILRLSCEPLVGDNLKSSPSDEALTTSDLIAVE